MKESVTLPSNHVFISLPVQNNTYLTRLLQFDYQTQIKDVPKPWLAELGMNEKDLISILNDRIRWIQSVFTKLI